VLGGVSDNEAFDVTPYALEASEYFMNHSHYHSLPRKIKIGFEGCPEDHTFIGIQDIGVQAALDANRDPFFQIYVGGGLSTQPFVAQLLEERTETGRLLATLEAVLKVFDQHGNRNDRKHARLKYLVLDLGIEKFRDLVFEERKKNFFVSRDFPQSLNSSRPCEGKPLKKLPSDLKFREWLETNIYWQKQKNFATVFVQCPLGNLPPKSLQALAHIGRKFHAQDIRTTITQNLALRGIHQNLLSALYRALRKNGLISLCPAGQITDITRCASADSCDSAFTSTRGLALALQGMLENSFGTHRSEIKNIRIKISGCPNACAQHSIASIGFHGLARRAGNYLIPSYRMFVGGNPSKGATCFGKLIGTIPARRIPQSVKDILEIFLRERKWNEDFSAFTHRVGSAALQNPLRAYQEYTPLDVVKENLFKDMGSDDIFSLPNLSKHEPD
ncbi:MAG: nitrite/sulfite reductase, partial [Candidatus Omnitrophica bacterium]|nr:nitrite/sulfite reductase [Candidatus Omnitrophota bacterium]